MTNVWSDFAARVAARLEAGARQYGDSSFARPPAELVGEIEEELADVAGWALIMFARVSSIAEAARRLREDTKGAEARLPDAEEKRDHGRQPVTDHKLRGDVAVGASLAKVEQVAQAQQGAPDTSDDTAMVNPDEYGEERR